MARIDDGLAAFCDRHHGRLVGMLTLYVGDVSTAEELAQDALVRLCQHWPRVREMANPTAWLDRVAMNLARSMFRRRAAAGRALTRHGPTGDAIDDDTATAVTVRRAVAGLPPRMRAAVIHRHLLGYSVRETAAAMGCAEGTVKSLTHRALIALRETGVADTTDLSVQEYTR